MLSYKQYKQLNESLYNLGIRSPNIISEPIGKTGVDAEDTIEEAKKKCGKMMKKGMDDSEEMKDDSEKDELEDDVEEKDSEDSEDGEEKEDDSEDGEEKEGEEKEDSEEKMSFMKKKMLKGDQHKLDANKNGKIDKEDFKLLKKKSKKEWSEIESDLNELIEGIENPEALVEVKKGLELMKKGMKKCACSESNMSEEEKSWWNSVNSMIG